MSSCEEAPRGDTGSRVTPRDDDPSKLALDRDLIHGQPLLTNDEGIDGRRLAIQHCQRCHVLPEPGVLPKSVWQDFVFPRMGALMGMHHVGVQTIIDQGRHPEEPRILEQAAVYPPRAELTVDDWETLMAYYLERAPDTLAMPASPAVAQSEWFETADFGYRNPNPNTTLVEIDEDSRRLFIGDMTTSSLSVLDPDLNRIQKIGMPSAPVHARVSGDRLWVTTIGSVNPSDFPAGELVVLKSQDGFYTTGAQKKLTALRRPTHASHADMNGDGLTDVIMSEYGNQLGALTYYQALQGGGYRKTELMNEPGSMISHVHDFNGDGWPDVAVILGQNREGVHIHYNRGGGSFTRSYALPLPPHYGSSSFSFHDFNADGHLDILATNGDNGDYRAIPKPFHGVRIYMNDGRNAFEEHYFFHLNGAYKALAEDFDLDGDLDIAAISMFPDLNNRPREGFVILENDGQMNFTASTIDRVGEGRWLCMDTGDLDGDGDKDIVIGSFINGPSEVPPSYMQTWKENALPGLVLWNRAR